MEVDQSPDGYTYKGGPYGDVEFPSITQDRQVIDQFLGVSPTTDTMTGQPLPAPSSVSVSVLNGTGAYDQAGTTASALAALGFHTVGVGDSPPVGEESETVVYFADKTPADQAAAQAVARSLSGSVVTALGPTTDGADVTVVTGSQFAVDQPAPTATTAPASGTTATTAPASTTTTTGAATSAASGSNSDFLPPTSAVTPLQPWDPRACTPAGGEGT